jgi:hypothetical protein
MVAAKACLVVHLPGDANIKVAALNTVAVALDEPATSSATPKILSPHKLHDSISDGVLKNAR